MGLSYTDVGGITVAFTESGQAAVERDLRRLDRNLFLDPERDGLGRIYWTVKYHRGDQRPAFILAWRDEDGTPRPLSSGLYHAVAERQRLFGRDLPRETLEHNDRLAEQRAAEAREELRETIREHEERLTGRKKTLIPRGVYLRRSRERRRSQGDVC